MVFIHNIQPVCDEFSRVLLLGSFPSVESRAQGFYYAHAQNRFWPLLAQLTGCPIPLSIEDKTALLHRQRLALWDVVATCRIDRSSDASLHDVTVNDISSLVKICPITSIFTNGQTAHKLYAKHLRDVIGLDDTCLPSTSAANARCRMHDLEIAWAALAQTLQEE